MTTELSIDQLSIATIRTLSVDAIQAANSGDPATPVGMAPVAYASWQHFLRYDRADPIWPNRDRFIVPAGHASMLLHGMPFLNGVKAVEPDYEIPGAQAVTLEDIRRFRQAASKCARHPEYHWTSGVETTIGLRGNGVAMAGNGF